MDDSVKTLLSARIDLEFRGGAQAVALHKTLVSSPIFAGIVLALCCPSTIISAFWAKVFKGDVGTAVVSVTTNLLSIITRLSPLV